MFISCVSQSADRQGFEVEVTVLNFFALEREQRNALLLDVLLKEFFFSCNVLKHKLQKSFSCFCHVLLSSALTCRSGINVEKMREWYQIKVKILRPQHVNTGVQICPMDLCVSRLFSAKLYCKALAVLRAVQTEEVKLQLGYQYELLFQVIKKVLIMSSTLQNVIFFYKVSEYL